MLAELLGEEIAPCLDLVRGASGSKGTLQSLAGELKTAFGLSSLIHSHVTKLVERLGE